MKTLNMLRNLCLILMALGLIIQPVGAQTIRPKSNSGVRGEKPDAVSAENNSAFNDYGELSPPTNDAFANAKQVFASEIGTNIEATGESGEPNPGNDPTRNSVWYKWTAPAYTGAEINTVGSNFDTTLAVFTGDSLSNLVLVGYNDDLQPGNSASRVRFNATVGVTYYIAVDGFGANTGSITIEARSGPSNELFANFIDLGSAPSGRFVGNNFDAGLNEPGETSFTYRTVWHRWTAPSSGPITFETCNYNSTFNTKIDIFTGTNLSLLNLVTSSFDGCGAGSPNSRLTFTATAGVTYLIRVGNFIQDTQGGAFFLDWGKPVEDDFNVLDGVYNFGNNILATGQSGEPNHAGQSAPFNSVWYKFTVSQNTFVEMDTRGSFLDTTLAVYTGNSLNALTLVAENDDEADGIVTSRVTFLAVPGRTYHIAVDGFSSQTGYFYLNYAFFRAAPFDFDGDAKSDVSIFRPAPGEWWYLRSSDGGNRAFQFGASTDKLIPADYTGDGKTDIAFWRPSNGNWFILRSEDSSFYAFPFGSDGDLPAPGDYDGDGKADAAVFRPATATWFINKSSGGTTILNFGANGDKPAIDDYDGDGQTDLAIWRPSVGEWWIRQSSTGSTFAFQFGISTDKPVPGDYTGDGKADIAFFRPSNGNWFVLRSEDFSFYSFPFGANGDLPVPGDYDGDGKIDSAVFRPSNVTWFMNRSTTGVQILNFGAAGDRPVPNAFVP